MYGLNNLPLVSQSIRILLALCVLCLIPSFVLPQKVTTSSTSVKSGLARKQVVEIKFRRSICYGSCPSYDFSINPEGQIIFIGLRNVKIVGKASSTIEPNQIEEIASEIRRLNYFSLRKSYATEKDGCVGIGSDDSWIVLDIRLNKQRHVVKHYLGCTSGNTKFNSELKRLIRLETYIENIINVEQWI